MRRVLGTAIFCAALAAFAPPARADLSKMSAESPDSFAKKTEVSVGELFDLRLKVGVFPAVCAYNIRIVGPPGSGVSDQEFKLEVVDDTTYKYRLPNGWGGSYQMPGFDVVVYGVPLLAPGQFEIRASSPDPSCKVKAPALVMNVRPDYGPMTISIYGRPGKSLVKRLDGGWAIAPGEKVLWISERAAADLKLMTDGYIPGAWAEIFPAAFSNAWADAGVKITDVREKGWGFNDTPPFADAGESNDDRLLVLALGREASWLKDDVAAGRLVRVVEFNPESMIAPLRDGARRVAEAGRAQVARSEANRSALGDPGTLVGIKVLASPQAESPRPGR